MFSHIVNPAGRLDSEHDMCMILDPYKLCTQVVLILHHLCGKLINMNILLIVACSIADGQLVRLPCNYLSVSESTPFDPDLNILLMLTSHHDILGISSPIKIPISWDDNRLDMLHYMVLWGEILITFSWKYQLSNIRQIGQSHGQMCQCISFKQQKALLFLTLEVGRNSVWVMARRFNKLSQNE